LNEYLHPFIDHRKGQNMKIHTLLGISGLGLVVALAIGLAPQEGRPAAKSLGAAETFTVDTVHSSVVFKIQHNGVTNFYGRFNDITGTYSIDAANPAASSFDFQVKADSVDTANAKRDGHLKSPDFFNATEFPSIAFKSTKVAKGANGQLAITGDLTLHGVTKPVTAATTVFPAKQAGNKSKSGFESVITIKRSDFGMNYGVADGGLGDEVQVIVAVEGAKS
jgi:polyisoprenoid-binding protein YceI